LFEGGRWLHAGKVASGEPQIAIECIVWHVVLLSSVSRIVGCSQGSQGVVET
jgi:hypothetical protein